MTLTSSSFTPPPLLGVGSVLEIGCILHYLLNSNEQTNEKNKHGSQCSPLQPSSPNTVRSPTPPYLLIPPMPCRPCAPPPLPSRLPTYLRRCPPPGACGFGFGFRCPDSYLTPGGTGWLAGWRAWMVLQTKHSSCLYLVRQTTTHRTYIMPTDSLLSLVLFRTCLFLSLPELRSFKSDKSVLTVS